MTTDFQNPDLQPADSNRDGAPTTPEYSIDELAREAGNTVRNVRSYQERGLLPPPQRRGRSSVYTQAHLARLRVIGRMLERGYSLANVGELITAWEQGQDIGELLGLEAALTSPWSDDPAVEVSSAELLELFDGQLSPAAAMRYMQMGMVTPLPDSRFLVHNFKLLKTSAMLAREGIPLDRLIDIFEQMRRNIEHNTEDLIRLVVEHVFDRYGRDCLPPPDKAPQLAAMMWQLRPLALEALNSEVARALERNVERFVGDRLSQILPSLDHQTALENPSSSTS